jgi:Mce-associated membrane protein
VTVTEPQSADDSRGWRVEVRVVPVLLITLIIASAGLAAWLYLGWYRQDNQTDQAVAHTAIDAANDGVVAILSYSPETVDDDVIAARTHLTGDFLSYYDDFAQKIVAPAAKEQAVKTTAEVVGAAVQELHPDAATVLMFVNQSTTSKENPDPSISASSALVTLTKVDDSWLISQFDPV